MYSIVTFPHVQVHNAKREGRALKALVAVIVGGLLALSATSRAHGQTPDFRMLQATPSTPVAVLCVWIDCGKYEAISPAGDGGYFAKQGNWFIYLDKDGKEKHRLVDPATKGR